MRVSVTEFKGEPFESFFDVKQQAKKRDWYGYAIHWMHDMIAIALVVALLFVPVMQAYNARHENEAVDTVESIVNGWNDSEIAGQIQAAKQYNVAIAQSGQPSLGEFDDPFSSSSATNPTQQDLDDQAVDPELRNSIYLKLLDVHDGIMGSIEIPKISVKLPIYHGTSNEVLDKGVGHLRGTSLPVGGKSTNAVLSGHRGLPSALLFTRLDQMHKGDLFFINVMRQKMAYRVVGVHVIDPTDTHLYTVQNGRDLVTLMTCTPYGINTSRLIITGERTAVPPEGVRKQGDGSLWSLLAMVAVLLVGFVVLKVRRAVHRIQPWPLHANGKFRGRWSRKARHKA
ncbi:sortase A [Bifidobacterium bohemicum]|uniref:Sortase family protein n=1 Tax=Bifidobacterium bohemicum DSM 22767 TaxID=1437606 RepID=A0A086ZEQ3_9BIFI|nr:class C sortase [Bifidobacterium bohemicum]KFI45003.1 sortase family protein [Bifidobacterium bohemicum DSM 22767]SCC13059.1 sortase A [Bifidobacterium bohemicum]